MTRHSRPILAAAALAAVALTPSATAAQDAGPRLPLTTACRSELDARLAFGLCPDGTFDFYAAGEYRDGIPTPEAVLGYPIGSWHTTYGRMETFLAALAATASDRVRVFDYGTSVERQVMHLVAVSSEANIARLEEVRASLQALSDPRRTDAGRAAALAGATPVAVWLNAANDGNESAAFEAAIQLAYQLAAGEDARTRALRDGAVVLINLAHNPESHERFVAWYNAFVMGDADPDALEHNAPWGLSTNNNHYQIDLNRDALGLTQTESRAVAAELQRWRPQVFVDLHGQTTQYFFPPPATPVLPFYPDSYVKWLERMGAQNAEAFDQHGWSYYVRDVFDLYYPGYWDTYPSLHGAIGMTYETDGGGGKGVRWRRDDGTILTFADGIAHHFVASLQTIETAVRNRVELLRDFHGHFASGMDGARRGGPRTVVWVPGDRPAEAARLATTLLRHGIEVSRTTASATFTGTSYLGGGRGRVSIPAGAYVVDLVQPNATLARTLLAPDVEMPAEFAAEQLARWARDIRRSADEEGFEFYDVTAWNLVLAAGLDGWWSNDGASLRAAPLTLPDGMAKAPGDWRTDVAWSRGGGVTGRARSAYVWPAGSLGSYRLLARLLDEGFSVAVTELPMVVDGADHPRGTFIARVGRNPASLHERIAALAAEAGVVATAAASAFPSRGSQGTGSEATRSLTQPRVAVLAGEGVSITSFGATWFHLERRIGQPFTALRATQLARTDLEKFDVIILPPGGYAGSLGDDGTERLAEWIRGGGVAIGWGGAASFLMGESFETSHVGAEELPEDSVAAIRTAIEAAAPAGTGLPPATSPGASPEAELSVPGAFLRTRVDRTHWLTLGYERAELPVLMRGRALPLSEDGANPVVFAEGNDLVIAGFSWPENTPRTYGGRAYATVDYVGRGRIVLFADEPIYRLVFDGPAGLLMNAIYLGARGRRDAAR
ncbi:MAG TPA: M14 family zinc carboxypeptidase [Longimicrobiales bacterium]|nr:M14 family zinc carboxypeptidase [Longimicrobiales bacterium]